MDPLSISASITALLQLTSTVIQYLNGVKGAPEDRRLILSELASVNGILFVLQDQADQAKQDDQWSSTLQSLNVPEGPLDQFRRALERLSSKLAPPATGLKKLGKAIIWPFQKEEIKEILGSIERQKALLNLARQNDHIRLSKAIKDDVALMRDEVEEVAKGVSKIQKSQITDEHPRIIKWLDGPDPWTNYNRALKARNLKTGSWFIRSSAFYDWKTTRGSFVWLHGIPGCGKTILSSAILQDVLDEYDAKPNSAVLFFYFDFNDAEKQLHEKMIRSLISQLSIHCANSVLQNLYLSCSNGGRQPTGEVLLTTLRQMMTSLGDTYIIVDALDECAERDELLTDLEEIVSWKDAHLHVLTTSRREKDIEEALTPLSDTRNRIGIQSTLVNTDIRTYVHDRLQIDRKLKRWQKHPKVQLEIEDTLMLKADGMFRWAACQLDSLGDCFTLPHLRQALASLPKTLDDTYARILCNIDKRYNDYNRYILKALQWLAFSTRPLQLEQLAEIFAIDIDETPRFDPERGLPEPRDILTMCSSLITLQNVVSNASDGEDGSELSEDSQEEEDGSEISEDSQDPDADSSFEMSDSGGSVTFVRLAHFSVKEYLVSDRIQHGTAPHYSIREIESHGVLAEYCLAYLLQFDELGSLKSETLRLSPLAPYAAKFWADHARLAEKGSIKSTTLLSMELFLAHGEGFLNWIRISDPDFTRRNLSRGLDSLAPPLYYASKTGLLESVRMLIKRSVDVNAQGGEYGNALQAASLEGHADIVHLLLDNGADINAQGGEYGNALQAASREGYADIVYLLLDNGANINAQGGYYGNALQAASLSGHTNIVHLLLDNGADINAQGGYYGNALQATSREGHADIVYLLLDNGANINAQGGYCGNALQAASRSRHIVHLLLDNGADINAQGGEYGNALQAASFEGNFDIVHLLLDNGADINAQGGEYGNALQAASFSHYGNAFNAAWFSRYIDIVHFLLNNGADINAQGGKYGNALQAASLSRYTYIVHLLLDNGANINAQGGEYDNALQAASFRGYADMVHLLLDNGADVNTQGGSYGTALIAACRGGYEKAVKMLLEKGADVNAVNDGSWGSALEAASENGHENVVKMLIAKGAVMPEEESSENEQEDDPPAQHVGELDPVAAPAVAN